jgi:2-dehydro-3-deoxy-D-gluconate 5-dehydrogenase
VLNQFDLTGRRALVTGGTGGLGSAMATALAGAGAEVAVLARSSAADVVADLSDRGELRRGFREVVERLGGLDILVASHGSNASHDALDFPLEDWDRVLEVNLTSVFELCRLAGRPMLAAGRGKIVTVASMLSFSGGLRVAAYAASKGGIAQLTKALANEWAGRGVNVNAIAPGYIKTDLNAHIWRDDPDRGAQVVARIPAGRWGEPDDLAGTVVFLASRASDYLHGAILPVDGGFLAR